MNSNLDENTSKTCWFVGATYGSDDQTPRFLREGIWENGYTDRYLELVKSARPGERIAIKASYTRKHGLPFDNRGRSVSIMGIKAIGVITENLGDGRTLKVRWETVEPQREWYFYTVMKMIWRVSPDAWEKEALIDFTFSGKAQDIDRFRNAPYWRDRFGDNAPSLNAFKWTNFYEAVADKLLTFRHRREELVAAIHNISTRVEGLAHLQDIFKDGSKGPLKDICPFTVMGIFNRKLKDENRKEIARELAQFLEISEEVPTGFDGVPLLNNQNSWLFAYDEHRKADDIDTLWEVFARALAFADSDDDVTKAAFMLAYDNAIVRKNVKWNLTMGLFWARPWFFLTLDGQSRLYIDKVLDMRIDTDTAKHCCSAANYLTLLDALRNRFQEDTYPVHSFPELSLAAWNFVDDKHIAIDDNEDDTAKAAAESERERIYTVDNIVEEGCFLEAAAIEKMLIQLRRKKNIILQGPPGTGKTWLAKRLAYALMGQKAGERIRAVQFHPNLSYEDFVRGWRPVSDKEGKGTLALVDGLFLEMIDIARKPENTKNEYVVVIEEINRGNPAQIFGEMLTLLEADKRTPNEALELSYRRADSERIYIPANLYVIGTMNIADRSLALVDLALRRRFAFINLQPLLGERWRRWVNQEFKLDENILLDIERRIIQLNTKITEDTSLGAQFQIGHSYVTPPLGANINDAKAWFRQIVENEIIPLLEEYWFDAPGKIREAENILLKGF